MPETKPEPEPEEKPQPTPEPKPGDPFRDLPATAALPLLNGEGEALAARGEPFLAGHVRAADDASWDLTLIGGENALSGTRQLLSLDKKPGADGPSWTVVLQDSSKGQEPLKTPVARFWRDRTAIKFQWLQGAEPATADNLRNCVLEVCLAGKTCPIMLGTPHKEPVNIPAPKKSPDSLRIPRADWPVVPDGTDLEEAQKFVQEAFGNEIAAAKTRQQKRLLAEKLMQSTAKESPANRWASLRAARDVAVEAGAAHEALSIAAQLGSFEDGKESTESLSAGRAAWGKKNRTLADAAEAMEHFKRALRSKSKLVSSAARTSMTEILDKLDPEMRKMHEGWQRFEEELRRKQIGRQPKPHK